jgi:tRNA uridine 5-carbamoylmethylation protein Kti12
MPKAYIMVGVPGSGKSHYVHNVLLKTHPHAVVASTDDLVDLYAKQHGSTYSEIFTEYMPTAVKLMTDTVREAVIDNRDIIWDQTSTTVASRKGKLRMIPNSYEKIAVVIRTPDSCELSFRLSNRPGKIIPEHVIKSMISRWQNPEMSEGFNEIINI